MAQIYSFSSLRVDSTAQIISFKDFSDTIKRYILYLLTYYEGLSCTEISVLSVVPVSSLTNALQKLIQEGSVYVSAFKRDSNTQRVVQVYSLLSQSKIA